MKATIQIEQEWTGGFWKGDRVECHIDASEVEAQEMVNLLGAISLLTSDLHHWVSTQKSGLDQRNSSLWI